MLDVAEFGAAVVCRRGGGVDVQDAEVVQFGEEEGFVAGAEGVRGGEKGEAVRELSGLELVLSMLSIIVSFVGYVGGGRALVRR